MWCLTRKQNQRIVYHCENKNVKQSVIDETSGTDQSNPGSIHAASCFCLASASLSHFSALVFIFFLSVCFTLLVHIIEIKFCWQNICTLQFAGGTLCFGANGNKYKLASISWYNFAHRRLQLKGNICTHIRALAQNNFQIPKTNITKQKQLTNQKWKATEQFQLFFKCMALYGKWYRTTYCTIHFTLFLILQSSFYIWAGV